MFWQDVKADSGRKSIARVDGRVRESEKESIQEKENMRERQSNQCSIAAHSLFFFTCLSQGCNWKRWQPENTCVIADEPGGLMIYITVYEIHFARSYSLRVPTNRMRRRHCRPASRPLIRKARFLFKVTIDQEIQRKIPCF